MRTQRVARALSLCVLAACSSACSRKDKQEEVTPQKETPTVAETPSSAPSGAPSAGVAVAPEPATKTVPTLVAERFAPGGDALEAVYPVEGALAVVKDRRVGRIVGEKVEWLGTLPELNGSLNGSTITSVHGVWPDGIDVIYMSNNYRALQPSYFPLTGKGVQHTVLPGANGGDVLGVVHRGDSTLLGTWSFTEGFVIKNVRGPGMSFSQQSPEQAGCKEGDFEEGSRLFPLPAVTPYVFGGTPQGTLMIFGNLCVKRGPVAEVWDKPGKSRIVDLGAWVKRMSSEPTILQGTGDELWVHVDAKEPILHYQSGTFSALPTLDKPVTKVFVSQQRQLHASDGQTIHRHEDGKWVPVAHFAWPMPLQNLVLDQGTFWATSGGVQRFREGSSLAMHDGCATPFVFLYDVSDKNPADFTFPTTRKALATFPGAAELSLVEFREGTRRLGVKVPSKEQGEALLAHAKTAMKDEAPRLLCYAPTKPRAIALAPKAK
ncbi:hypothetical protein [Chondromyces apiculatus]|uniref:Lipoprotein n=1 Tax=Chondromyces apiculatus DSM 436 TaxID=1192034 RepID=A0A017TBA1_9BACT|nr:hypothetical protein [Chondromyces apiculatus]EYF06085.1 Hypothetical protein CAP_2275 [Chondromyces apiculatus DSM 436]